MIVTTCRRLCVVVYCFKQFTFLIVYKGMSAHKFLNIPKSWNDTETNKTHFPLKDSVLGLEMRLFYSVCDIYILVLCVYVFYCKSNWFLPLIVGLLLVYNENLRWTAHLSSTTL